MFHSLSMFLAPDNAISQATLTSPPAQEQPAAHRPKQAGTSYRFMASVVMNAIGFGGLLAGCWFSLQLMEIAFL